MDKMKYQPQVTFTTIVHTPYTRRTYAHNHGKDYHMSHSEPPTKKVKVEQTDYEPDGPFGVRVIFQFPNPDKFRPFRFRLSRSDPPGGPTNVSRPPIVPKLGTYLGPNSSPGEESGPFFVTCELLGTPPVSPPQEHALDRAPGA